MAYKRTKAGREERANKFRELTQRLDAYEEELDEAVKALIVAKFSGYSERNAMLIAMQATEAGIEVTDLDGFKTWLSRGRVVRKGEHGIAILAPAGDGMRKAEREQAAADAAAKGEEPTGRRQFFRLAYLFDISQTDELELDPDAQPAERATV